MRFKRYAALMPVWIITISVTLFWFFLFALRDIVRSGDFTTFFVALVFSLVLPSFVRLTVFMTAKSIDKESSLNDYVLMTESNVTLYYDKEDKLIRIYWENVISYRSLRPIRGIQKSVIIDKYGQRILFASTNRLDKKIFALRPELKKVFEKKAIDE